MVKQTSTDRRESLFNKLKTKDITIPEALSYDSKQWFHAGLSTKVLKQDSLEGQKYLLKQIPLHKQEVLTYHFKKRQITNKDFQELTTKRLDTLSETTPIKLQIKKIEGYEPDYKIGIPKKEGVYGIVLVKDYKNKKDFWIKYHSEAELNERLEALESDSLESEYWIIFKGFGRKRPFVKKDFVKKLAKT